MTAPDTPEGATPSADVLKERVEELGQESDLGSGEQEPDPVTSEAPPQDLQSGDSKRRPD